MMITGPPVSIAISVLSVSTDTSGVPLLIAKSSCVGGRKNDLVIPDMIGVPLELLSSRFLFTPLTLM